MHNETLWHDQSDGDFSSAIRVTLYASSGSTYKSLFGLSIAASVVAIIYTPFALARRWPVVLSVAPVRFIQNFAGVAPLLFLNKLPLYQPMVQAKFLEVWLVATMLYFAAGGLMLVANYRQLEDQQARRAE